MQVIETKDELERIVLTQTQDMRAPLADQVIERWGLPVYAHRFPGGGCQRDCYGGWGDESCRPVHAERQ